MLFACCAVIAVVIFTLQSKQDKALTGYGREKKYSDSLYSALASKTVKPVEEYVSTDRKMNNFKIENSKYASFDTKMSDKCINVRVLDDRGRVSVMELEDYVSGCVLGEMPLGFETQALMAQAVAVRTFTVRQMSGKSKHKNADVCTNPACCQKYIDKDSKKINAENLEKLSAAVNATKGMIITYEGEPIEAVYHASSGECTLDSEDVWGGRVEYLRSTPSPEGEALLTSVVYGHRVGMSQHGANLLAKEGKCYADIIKYYYKGVSLDFV